MSTLSTPDSRKVFNLAHQTARQNAAEFCMVAPDGWLARFEPPKKSRDQEEKYHAMFGEIAKTRSFMGKRHDIETWKRLLVDAFARIKAAEGEPLQGHGAIMPNLDGTGFIQLGVQTRNLTKAQASEFIEFLNAWMAEQEVAA